MPVFVVALTKGYINPGSAFIAEGTGYNIN